MKLRSDTSIKTERLWLRKIDETDAEAIVSLRQDEDVYKTMNDIIVIIPAYNPDKKMLILIKALRNIFEHIIVIDDGSSLQDSKDVLRTAEDAFNCIVLRHSINLGQGRAYKTGFNYVLSDDYICKYGRPIGVIQCDCDGQHDIADIDRCAKLLRNNPEKFILGVRDFSDKSIPFRSRFGNKCTSLVFKIFCGLDVGDTQTGLKGVPFSFLPKLMETPGERFEYASSVLLETKKDGIDIIQFPIQTIYINENESSHFNPIIDSIRIYSLILKYLMSSLSSFVVDIVCYSLFITALKPISPQFYIIIATYLSKVFACSYGYILNKKVVFQNKGEPLITGLKFFLLCVVQSTCSGFLTRGVVFISGWNEVLCKIIVDTLLFFVSFQIQNRWVFKNNEK